jgi:hypothetical protein
VLGVNVYGISHADVLLFGVTASVPAALGAVLGGLLDDHVGSKPVILGSLASTIAVGLTLLALSGAMAFWVCGRLLCLFIGPTLSAARTLLLRMTADGTEGVVFGSLHDHGPGGVIPGAVAVLHVRQHLRHRPRRHGRPAGRACRRFRGDAAGASPGGQQGQLVVCLANNQGLFGRICA